MANANAHARKHRKALRKAGLRPLQLCVPESHHPDFVEECRSQSRLAAQEDVAETDLQRFMDEAPTDIAGWSE